MRIRNNLNDFYNRDRKILYVVLSVVVISLLSLTIVYAALSTTLNINGNAEVSSANWDIHFDNIQINPASVDETTTPTITGTKTINFGVTLTKPGDFYKFTIDIVNNGSIDAMIDSVVKTPELTAEQAKYIKYEIEYTDGNSISSKQLLPKSETKTISVLVSYRTDLTASDLPSSATTLDLSFKMIYVHADSTGTVVPEGTIVKVVSGDLDTVGSEICIGEECFYLMKNDGRSVTMLAMYNLYAGGVHDGSAWTSYGEEAIGRQDSTMNGYVPEQTIRNGTIAFSSTSYWSSDIYSTYVYNEKSNLYIPVENYKSIIESMKVNVEEARLIKYEELVSLGCSSNSYSCSSSSYSWIYSTSYWTGSTRSSINIWDVHSNGGFGDTDYRNQSTMGIRPVIKIPLTEF